MSLQKVILEEPDYETESDKLETKLEHFWNKYKDFFAYKRSLDYNHNLMVKKIILYTRVLD